MIKKIFKILTITFFAIVAIFVFIVFVFGEKKVSVTLPSPTPTVRPATFRTLAPEPETTGKFDVDGVKVNDFREYAPPTGALEESTFINEEDYKATYYPLDEAFLIFILASPFDEIKQKAESDFLSKLGVSKEEACRLTLAITTPGSINPKEAGINHKLSFCEQ